MDTYNKIPAKNIKSLVEAAYDVLINEKLSTEKSDQETVKSIDTACERIRNDLKHIHSLPNGEDIIAGACLEYGALVVSLLKGTFREGEWYYHSISQGEFTYPFVYSGGVLFPVFWVNRRIHDKKSKSISSLFKSALE
jgi:hypothetical protein